MWRRNQLFSLIPCRDPKRPRLRLRIACLGLPLYAYPYIYRHLPREDKRGRGRRMGGGKGGGRFIEIEKRGGVEDLRSIAILQPSRDSCNGRPPSWASFLITGKGPHCFCLNQRKKSTPLLRKEQRACPLPSLHTHTHIICIYMCMRACTLPSLHTHTPSHSFFKL